jgi:1-acyl-sn-glycerol-3-phosphate acyltransferase
MCKLFRAGFYELFDGAVYGLENVPKGEACLLACNHASYFDPPFLGAMFSSELFSFAKKSLFNSRGWEWLFVRLNCIPVDRERADIEAIRSVLKLLKTGKCIMIFPEGTRSRNGELGKAQPGVGLFACKSGVNVIPCRIFGTYRIMNRFSHFPNFNEKVALVFGKPLRVSECGAGDSATANYQNVAAAVMDRIRALEIPDQNIL